MLEFFVLIKLKDAMIFMVNTLQEKLAIAAGQKRR